MVQFTAVNFRGYVEDWLLQTLMKEVPLATALNILSSLKYHDVVGSTLLWEGKYLGDDWMT